MADQDAPDTAYVEPVVLARGPSAGGGELVLRSRPGAGRGGTDVVELIVDGVFAMDTVEVSTELRLASETLRRLSGAHLRVVVGGLGLGFTLRELLSDQRVGPVEVVELEPTLVQWLRGGLVASARGLLDDERVEVTVDDVATRLTRLDPASVDAILLDVDNGPEFLVHQQNSVLYGAPLIGRALAALRPGGVLAVWSADPSPALLEVLRTSSGAVEEVALPVHRDGRTFAYVLYLASTG